MESTLTSRMSHSFAPPCRRNPLLMPFSCSRSVTERCSISTCRSALTFPRTSPSAKEYSVKNTSLHAMTCSITAWRAFNSAVPCSEIRYAYFTSYIFESINRKLSMNSTFIKLGHTYSSGFCPPMCSGTAVPALPRISCFSSRSVPEA
ncbi:hypothetical protein D3C72_1858710 [compost metagenome]